MRGVDKPGAGCEHAGPFHFFYSAMRDAMVVAIACSMIGIAVNALRSDGIALIQKSDYQILVPCPVIEGEVEAIGANDARLGEPRTLAIDARPPEEFNLWRVKDAMNVPYDYLAPTDPGVIAKIAASGARRVVVYGDGADPDSGEQLAKELAGKGIRNVAFVRGGAGELNKSPRPGGAP